MPGMLVLSLNQSVLGEFPLDKERVVIGRKPESDVQVDKVKRGMVIAAGGSWADAKE